MIVNKQMVFGAFLLFALFSCFQKQKPFPDNNNKKINLMLHAVVPYNFETGYSLPHDTSYFKIVTYLNLYCDPCWEYITLWKNFLKENPEFAKVSFFIYIGATIEDFETKNANKNIVFPVFLDTNQRFRIVNKLGSDPNLLTFLCNQKNEVLLTGPPFSLEMKKKYLRIISTKNYFK